MWKKVKFFREGGDWTMERLSQYQSFHRPVVQSPHPLILRGVVEGVGLRREGADAEEVALEVARTVDDVGGDDAEHRQEPCVREDVEADNKNR